MDKTYQNKTYHFPLLHRALHWGIAFGILFILLTVFLRLTWMNKSYMGEIMQSQLALSNIQISNAESISVAKAIRDNMFQWHHYAGYAVAILFVIRIGYIFFEGKKYLSIISGDVPIKRKFQLIVYILFYIFLGITLITGITIANSVEKTQLVETFKSIHKSALYFMIIFLILHFGGIILGEETDEKGIVSSMINGGNEEKD